MEWYLKYKQASGIVSSKAWTTSLKTDTKIINSLRSNSMIFTDNTIYSHLRTVRFPAEGLLYHIISVGVFTFWISLLSVCKASLRRYDAPGRRGHLDRGGFARRRSLHVKNVFVQESGTMALIKISVYMKFASIYHGQQLCSCDSASLKRFVKST